MRGLDVVLPGNALLRSARSDGNDERMRYSYVEPDGETYDISHIVEEEWRESVSSQQGGDLLQNVVSKNKGNLGDQLDRVLNKIKNEKQSELERSGSLQSQRGLGAIGSEMTRSVSPSEYSDEGNSRSVTPGSAGLNSRAMANGGKQTHTKGNPSIGSAVSEGSGRATPLGAGSRSKASDSPRSQGKKPILPKDDFGISQMMAIIECKSIQPPKKPTKPVDPADELLFGKPVDLESLHPQVREVYAAGFKQLEEMDRVSRFFPLLPC